MNESKLTVGLDVTKLLGIVKHDPEAALEAKMKAQMDAKRGPVVKYLLKYSVFRYFYFKYTNRRKYNWPQWIKKTDETRIQKYPAVIQKYKGQIFDMTEKLDGQSVTFYVDKNSMFGRLRFGVCSRNVPLRRSGNQYWKMADKYNLEKILRSLGNQWVIQGEIIGPGIQKNKYKLADFDLAVYNVIDPSGKRYNSAELMAFCTEHGLNYVPYLGECMFNDITEVSDVVKMSIRNSILKTDEPREGVVFRLRSDPTVSFKAINPEFLLKWEGKEDEVDETAIAEE